MSVTRIFSLAAAAVLGLALAVGLSGRAPARDPGLSLSRPAPERDTRFVSGEAALEQGMGAYKAGYYDLAVPALTFAADAGLFFGRYYLAQIYADNGTALTDHGKAYKLFLGIVDAHANVDPDDDWRANYVGRSLTAVARYTLRGLPEIGLVPNTERAAKFLRDAATFFGDAGAQFELARMYLSAEGVREERRLAFHWLSTLTQKGHAAAQAFLAELLWKGKELPRDEVRALALVTVAIANAPEADRIWIEDIYQNIYCGASGDVRRQADSLVSVWKRIYAPRSEPERSERIVGPSARTCSSGERLPMPERDTRAQDTRSGLQRRGAGPAPSDMRAVGATAR